MFRAGPCFAKRLAWHAFGSHSDIYTDTSGTHPDTSGHTGDTLATCGAKVGGHTGKHRTHSKKWGGHTGHIADTSRTHRVFDTRGAHADTSRTHPHIPSACAKRFVSLPAAVSQPDSFRFSATPTCFEMALQGQEHLFLKSAQKPLLLTHGLCMMIFYYKNNIL